MCDIFSLKNIVPSRFIWLLVLLILTVPRTADTATLDSRYPALSSGLLGTAELVPLDKDTLLVADGFTIKHSQLLESIKDNDPALRGQLEKNLLFVLEQEAVRRVLLNQAKKAGISLKGTDDSQAFQALFEQKTKGLFVSDQEARDFYKSNKEMVCGAPFNQVADGIRQYLLQDKKQKAVTGFINNLGESENFRINEKWVASQYRMALDNPVDWARRSGKPTMVEFGATGCVPCDMMQPILDKLRKEYPQRLNVVFVHVGEEQILAARYGIRSIPVQVFFDAKGKEVFRHVGFYPENEVTKQINQMGVVK